MFSTRTCYQLLHSWRDESLINRLGRHRADSRLKERSSLASSPRLRSVFVGLTSKYGSERRVATLGARASFAAPRGAGPGRRSPYKETSDTKFPRTGYLSTYVRGEMPHRAGRCERGHGEMNTRYSPQREL